MGLINKIMRVVDVLTEDDSVDKGNEFEKYVADHFDKRFFSIIHDKRFFSIIQWSTDITRKHDRVVESDMCPDLVIRYKPKDEMFCVECKFRSALYENELHWSNFQQLGRYRDFAREKEFPFFVVIGLGRNPSQPEKCFAYPLKKQGILHFFQAYLKGLNEILRNISSGEMES